MAGILWRLLFAVIVVALVFALIPPLVELAGIGVHSAVITIVRICVVGLAIFFVLRGQQVP